MMSCGALMNAAPGRPDSAARNAFATTSETATGESISALNLVIGRNRLTVSMLWWICFKRFAMGTAPPMATTGSPSEFAVARPVTRFEQPGPEVTSVTPALPVMRPMPPAMNAAFCSWRQTTVLILESSSVSNTLSIFAPGMPKTYSTPCASRLFTSTSAPVGVLIASPPPPSRDPRRDPGADRPSGNPRCRAARRDNRPRAGSKGAGRPRGTAAGARRR